MDVGYQPDDRDPAQLVAEPVVLALHRIVVQALLGLLLVAVAALLPLGLRAEPAVHETLHFLIPAGWVGYAALVGLRLALRRPPDGTDVWERAARIDPGLWRLARLASNLMLAGWLGVMATVLVHHHLSSPRDVVVGVGIITPLTLAAWILAAVAWSASCRADLARAEQDAALRLRRYWHGVSSSARHP